MADSKPKEEPKKKSGNELSVTTQESKSLQRMITVESEKRKMITQFITGHMVEGTDYGKIHVMSRSKCPEPWNCKNPGHFSKDTLYKPGSEKFVSLMHLTPKFRKDTDTWEMLGSKAGVVCYICELYDVKGTVIGEGRGAANLAEETNGSTANKLIKIAEKRAQMDAVLRTGGLSDFFTQDLDDPSQRGQLESGEDKPKMQPAPQEQRMITEFQMKKINTIISNKNFDRAKVHGAYKVASFKDLTLVKANKVIEDLERRPANPAAGKAEEGEVVTRSNAPDGSEDIDPASVPI